MVQGAILALLLCGQAHSAALPTEANTYVRSVRIVAVSTFPAPGTLPSENKQYILDVKAFNLTLSDITTDIDAITNSIVLIDTGMNAYSIMTQNTDGTLSVVSTPTTTTTYTFLSNGSFTSWVTADNSDSVLREKQTSISIQFSNIAMFDSNNTIWIMSMDSDGVYKTTSAGGL